jgi:hypothetical protein
VNTPEVQQREQHNMASNVKSFGPKAVVAVRGEQEIAELDRERRAAQNALKSEMEVLTLMRGAQGAMDFFVQGAPNADQTRRDWQEAVGRAAVFQIHEVIIQADTFSEVTDAYNRALGLEPVGATLAQ